MTEPAGIWAWLGAIDARIWQAVVAGLFLAFGWLVNGRQNRRAAAGQAAQARQDAADLRAERLRDVHRALYAEIGASLATFGSAEAIEEGGAKIAGRMRENDGYHPFIARLGRAGVFDAIVTDIHILPRTSIDATVAFYGQLSAIDALTEDLRSAEVKLLSADRRVALYEDYTALRKQAFYYGNHALRMIDAYAKGGKQAALELEKKISSLRSADRSDP